MDCGLAHLSPTRFQQAGKFIVLNPTSNMLEPMVIEQIRALQGVSTDTLMMVRPKDFWDCTDYGDGGAAVVTLPEPGYVLREDGSLSAQTATVTLRNAEAVIVYGISTAPSSTSSTPTTVTVNTVTQSLTATTFDDADHTSTTPSSLRSSKDKSTGLLGKLKGLMERVK